MADNGNKLSFKQRSQKINKQLMNKLTTNTSKEFLAEFIGTFFLIIIGNGAMANLSLGKPNSLSLFAINFCFGIGAMIGLSASLRISGGHINPAVTIGLATIRKFPWNKTIHYIIAQYLGALLASGVVYLVYYEAIENHDPLHIAYDSVNSTGNIFATYPADYLSIRGALVDQIIGTAILLFAVLAITDNAGIQTPTFLQPLIVALSLAGICSAFSINCGAILNPARDLAPRIMSTIVGYGWSSFEPLGGHYWWVAGVIGPHFGGIIGSWLFLLTIDHEAIQFSCSKSSSKCEITANNESSEVKEANKDAKITIIKE